MQPTTRPRVVLAGPPGSGKSTVADALGALTGWPVRDTDADVEVRAGKPISEIFLDDGEPAFRALERDAVAAAVAGHDGAPAHDGVLALGGGAVLDAATQDVLAAYASDGGTVVFLDVSLAHAAPRVGFNVSRPLLVGNPRAQWQRLMTERRPVYERVATLRVDTDARTPEDVAREILASLGVEPRAGVTIAAPDAPDVALPVDGPVDVVIQTRTEGSPS